MGWIVLLVTSCMGWIAEILMGWIALLVTSCMGWIALRNTLPCRCLLNQKPISESQLLLAAVPKAAGTKETWKELMETLAWSFTALYDGACPKKDKAGKPMELQKGKRFRKGWLWAITGDLEWYASEFSWPYSASNYICPYCAADQLLEGSTKPFTDMRPSAAWRATVLPPEELKKKFTHPLFAIPGVNALSLKLDILHVLDLGVSAYLHGSVLVSIMDKLGGTSSLLAAMWFSDFFKSTKGLVFQNIRALFFGQRAGQPFL